MSYHETYEFFAIDQCLTPTAMRTLRVISSRATITPARFYNSYDWGGLNSDPREMLRRYFDLFVHTGNGRPEWVCAVVNTELRSMTNVIILNA